jgi:transcriptional regulator with XRE-family HTH domain
MKVGFKIDLEMARKKAGDEAFARRLAAVRRMRGMTQIDLAEAAGTTQRAVSYYENAFGFPPAPQLVALAKALRVTTDELLGLKPIKADSRSEDPETRRLWKKFQQVADLPEKDQRAVIRLINSLSGLRE